MPKKLSEVVLNEELIKIQMSALLVDILDNFDFGGGNHIEWSQYNPEIANGVLHFALRNEEETAQFAVQVMVKPGARIRDRYPPVTNTKKEDEEVARLLEEGPPTRPVKKWRTE